MKLTRGELVLIEATTVFDWRSIQRLHPERFLTYSNWEDFILKVGAALLEDGEVDITFERDDLLFLRDTVDIYAREGKEPVGYNLKRKIYKEISNIDFTQAFGIPILEVEPAHEKPGDGSCEDACPHKGTDDCSCSDSGTSPSAES